MKPATWKWHRGKEQCTTEGMTPPPGNGWTLVPGQVPSGKVK